MKSAIYYLAKTMEATGLAVIVFGFLKHFPKLMDPKIFGAGILIFLSGWLIEAFLLKR